MEALMNTGTNPASQPSSSDFPIEDDDSLAVQEPTIGATDKFDTATGRIIPTTLPSPVTSRDSTASGHPRSPAFCDFPMEL